MKKFKISVSDLVVVIDRLFRFGPLSWDTIYDLYVFKEKLLK